MDIIEALLKQITNGGPGGIIAILLLVMLAVVWDRHRTLKEVQKKDEKLDRIIEDYNEGLLTVTEAINGVKLVLAEIKAKIT